MQIKAILARILAVLLLAATLLSSVVSAAYALEEELSPNATPTDMIRGSSAADNSRENAGEKEYPATATDLELVPGASLVAEGDSLEIEASFSERQASNVVRLVFTYDGDFEFSDYHLPEGEDVSVIDVATGTDYAKLVLMAQNYDAEKLGALELRVKDDAALDRREREIGLDLSYVLRDENGDKREYELRASASVLTTDCDTDDSGAVDLIDLSNIIDWFGYHEGEADWESLYRYFDFNGDHEIDIYDIAKIAKKIGGVSGDYPGDGDDEINVYTVTFIDYDGTVLKTQEVEEGQSADAPDAPAREGYAFTGWDVDFSNVMEDLTVTAQYEENKDVSVYSVTFIDYDGAVLKTQEVEEGQSADAPDAPAREGYAFTGWDVDFSNVMEDLTVTAQYEENKDVSVYTVTFIDYDGTVLKTQEVEEGQSADAPDAPAREGYAFTGWDVDFSNVTEDLTVTAQYEENSGNGPIDNNNDDDNDDNNNSSRSRGGSGGGGLRGLTIQDDSVPLANLNTVRWIEQAAGNHSQDTGLVGIRRAALLAITGGRYMHDTMNGLAVDVRVTLLSPATAMKDILLTGRVRGLGVDLIRAVFQKWFRNRIAVVSLEQSGSFDMPVEVAAKTDLTGMDAENLYFYSYNQAMNNYQKIDTEYWIDTNGYLRFNTTVGNSIIISDGALSRG